MKERIQLSDHFTYKRLLRFVMPSVIMMIFTSIYGVVDGLFVSNFAGKTPFAAINFVFPLIIILGAFGFMIGTGGTAIVAKTFGLGDKKRANEYFSFLIYTTVVFGIALSVLGILLARPVSRMLGATGEMLECCVTYARIVLIGMPFFMLQNIFQSFFNTAEKPKLGLLITVIAGVTNIVLDALLVAVFNLGLVGAAVATAASQLVGGTIPIIYFASKNSSTLRLGKTGVHLKMLGRTCINGSSELMSNISASVVTILYNSQLMRFAGENGVAAYGAIMYVAFIFIAIFIGFVIASSPIVSYHFGAGNTPELKNLYKKSIAIVITVGAAMTVTALLLSAPLTKLFVGYDGELYRMTLRGFIIYSFSYMLSGLNIFGSSFFTALNNGVVSAVISFMRTLVFQCAAVLILPHFFELDGVWFSVIMVETLSIAVTGTFLLANRKKYQY